MIVSLFPTPLLVSEFNFRPELLEWVKKHYEHSTYHEGDSGLDLFTTEDIIIPAKQLSFQIDLKIACEAFIDKNKQGNISYYLYPRSSMGAKTPLRLSNSVGIIDAGYRGDLMAVFNNTNWDGFSVGSGSYSVNMGDRLVQICTPNITYPMRVEMVDNLSDLGVTKRNQDGFGSTGS